MTVGHNLLKSTAKALRAYHCCIQAGLTIGIGIGLSVISSIVVYNWEQKSLQAEHHSKLDKVVINIEREINGNLEVVQAVSSLYNLFDEVKEQDFQTFVTSSIYRHPSIQAIAWLPRVSEQQRIFYETTAQKAGYPNFQITQQTQQGQIIRARQRQEYFPADVVSFFGKEMLTGLDFAANPIDQAALNRAAEQDEMIVTGRNHLLRKQDNQLNFFVFVPIYNQDIPKTSTGKTINSPNLRRKNLKGFVLGVFQIDAIVKTAVQDVNLDSTNLSLQDLIAPKEQRFLAFYEAKKTKLITNPSREKDQERGQKVYCRPGSACTHILNVENRRWLVQLLQPPEGITPQKHWRWATLIVGLLLTSIVSIYLHIVLLYTEKIEKVVGERTAQSKQLQQAFQELQQTQTQLVQTEKMSTLGLLVAGVAHEINNPINFISGNLKYANNYTQDLLKLVAIYQKYYTAPHPDVQNYAEEIDLEFLMKDMPQLMNSMNVGAERILQLVLSLRNFSRLDESDMKAVNIHEGIDSTLLILQNKLKVQPNYPSIEIVKKYGDLPLVECYAGQLNQVFMNIIANAIDALDSYNSERGYQDVIDNPSRITIETEYLPADYIKVRITDNGPGMTEDVKKRLFEPFFTTKPAGKGTGLGLSISYQIVVDKHKGALWCESGLGKGTEFCISIASRQDVKQAKLTTQLKQRLKQDSRH